MRRGGHGKCRKVIRIIPDKLGFRIEEYIPYKDFTHSGHVGRVVGRVWN